MRLRDLEATDQCDIDHLLKLRAYSQGKFESYKYKLLPAKPGEHAEDYSARLNMFVYTPVIASALDDLMNKFAQGQLKVYSQTPTVQVLPARIDEESQLRHALRNALTDGCYYAMIRPDRSLRWLSRESVIKQTATGAKLRWDTQYTSLGESQPTVYRTWTLVYADRYEYVTAEVRLSPKGKITALDIGNGMVTNGLADLDLPMTVVPHSFGRVPLFKLSTGSIAELAMTQQEQYIRVENSRQMAGYTSGYVQRVFTPLNDGSNAGVEVDLGIKTGNEYTLTGQNFQFVESPGTAVANQTKLLEDIRLTIKQLVNISGLSWTGPIQASGVSKGYEVESLEASLTAYGLKVTQFWQEILRTLDPSAQYDCSGYDDFSFDTADNALDLLAKAIAVEEQLAPTAMQQLRLQASKTIAEGCSLSISKDIEAEVLSYGR